MQPINTTRDTENIEALQEVGVVRPTGYCIMGVTHSIAPARSRKRRTSIVFSHTPLEITARVCSAATGRSKSLLGRVSQPLKRSSSLFEIAARAGSLLFTAIENTTPALHCSQTSFLFDSTSVYPSESLSKARCLKLCNASNCAMCNFTSTVTCHMRI